MADSVKPIPEGYHSVTPYIVVKGAQKAIEFYQQAFGANEVLRLEGPGGVIAHAEIEIGNSRVMLADEHPDMDALSPETVGGSPVSLLVYVEDCDAVFEKALEAGASLLRPMVDQFYGDRSGMVTDPFGHTWSIATHIEDLTQDEIEKRFADMMSGEE